MEKSKLTPMLRQYLEIKEEHPDALLFFRMGDFYELFFEDARIAAKELQIALTTRNPNAEHKVPMCGVPHHALHDYLSPLLEKRYKIAICDQVEDPKQAKGLVKRAVTRVLTPGTVIEETSLQAKNHNFLAACFFNTRGPGAVAWIDFSTGEWSGMQRTNQTILVQWLEKVNPREILCPEDQFPPCGQDLKHRISKLSPSTYFDLKRATELLQRYQQVPNLTPLDLEDKPQLVRCLGALLTYLLQTQNSDLSHLQQFKPLSLDNYLLIDEVSEKNLELLQRLDGQKGPGTLRHVLDQTLTPMGARLLVTRIKQPWRRIQAILDNQDVVNYFFNDQELLKKIRTTLEDIHDLSRIINRIHLNRCLPKDFIALKNSLQHIPMLGQLLGTPGQGKQPKLLRDFVQKWDNLEDLFTLLHRSLKDNPPNLITEGGLFKPGYDQKLDELLELTEHGEQKLRELLEQEQVRSGLPKLKLGFNRVFGYYFELSKANKAQVPEHFHRRQTLANAERYTTEELKTLESKLFAAAEQRKNLEYTLFNELRNQVAKHRQRIAHMAEIVAQVDYWQSLAFVARKWQWTKPLLHTGLELKITQGRHPVVEAMQGRANYIPNDLQLDTKSKVLLITGPNMAGKSTVLRQAALICILGQMGSFVPADKAKIGLADRIFTRVGASDNLAMGQSTFMVEMVETARILRQATKKSLVILDEIGRGTSTFDGLSLAWAVVEFLAFKGKQGIRTLFATHYHELTDLEGQVPGLKNYNIAVKEWKGEIIFLRKMVPGPADKSYGLEVAKLAGVPGRVIKRGQEVLAELEKKGKFLRRRVNKKLGNQLQDSKVEDPRIFSEIEIRQQTLPLGQDGQAKSDLNEPGKHILAKIKATDLNQTTPLEALNLIAKWQKELK